MSSASSSSSKRVRQAIQGSDVSESSAQPASRSRRTASQAKIRETADSEAATPEQASPTTSEQPASSQRGALSLQRHRSHSMDNRPVDPSPIQVSHTVSMAGQRPIGVSDNEGPVRFNKSRTILNRPIAPNTTAADDAMLEYLD